MIWKDNQAIDCPCTSDCERHGKCCECVTHHMEKGSLPACLREKKKDRKRDRKK